MWHKSTDLSTTQISTTCSNAAEVAQWATPCCSRPQPAQRW